MGILQASTRAAAAGGDRIAPLQSAGRGAVPALVRRLRDGNARGGLEGFGAGAAVLVWIGKPDEDALRPHARACADRRAHRRRELPYVLDTIRRGRPGEVCRRRRRAGDRLGARRSRCGLAARLPALREPSSTSDSQDARERSQPSRRRSFPDCRTAVSRDHASSALQAGGVTSALPGAGASYRSSASCRRNCRPTAVAATVRAVLATRRRGRSAK